MAAQVLNSSIITLVTMPLQLEFGFDVSGSLPEPMYFGMVSFNKFTKDEIIDNLFNQHPYVEKSKARDLTKPKILDVLRLLNEKKVRMFVYKLRKDTVYHYIMKYGQTHEFDERMYGLIYYNLVNQIAQPNSRYSVYRIARSVLAR